jgi:precorrin-2 dehydrogenase/sirohydrochlorin ferrochelatase
VRHAYPLILDVSERLVVIIGGGAVALRKVLGLLAAGATRIRCVAPEFVEGLPEGLELVRESYEPRHLEGAGLVFAATDSPEVNDAVVREARHRGVLASRADTDEQNPGDFSTPAMLRDGPLIVTVSTEGSPALAARIRDDLADKIEPVHGQMAAAMQMYRPLIRDAAGLSQQRRREVFRAMASDEAMKELESGGLEALDAWLTRKWPELAPGNDL